MKPTLWSQTLIPTSRQTPGDAVVPSHQLMLRAGLIKQLGSGSYDYLPLGLRSLQKASQIIRQEMDDSGAVEVLMPTLQPIDLWEQTQRRETYGENLFVLKDRHGAEQALGPTHEEVATDLIKAHVDSYKQLPINIYQIQTKFRDEFRPRYGVMRSREFQMKDAYSFDINLAGLNRSYDIMYETYQRIFTRCGVPFEIVEADAGPIGGNASHEFMIPAPTGEDTILKSDRGNYAANVEKCEIGDRHWSFDGDALGESEVIATPGCGSIEEVCQFFKKKLGSKLKAQNMIKTLVCQGDGRWIVAVVRGDHELNEVKLKHVAGCENLVLADEDSAKAAGFVIGFVGPQIITTRDDVSLIIDPDVANAGFWVTGANKVDHHTKLFDWKLDVLSKLDGSAKKKMMVADIRNAVAGDPSPRNDGGILEETKGIEVGHVFKLGTKYTEALNAHVLDANNQRVAPLMGCYGIGVNRILAGAIEAGTADRQGHDEHGIIWPAAIAPYKVVITTIKYDGQAKEVALDLAGQLQSIHPKGTLEHIDVIIDDRDERPGVKFKDADLIGFPIRITIGDKGLKQGQVEIKLRTADQPEFIKLEDVRQTVVKLLASC